MAIKATKDMCFFCFEVLEAALHELEAPTAPHWIPNDESLIFVTWWKNSTISGDPDLRGCKGSVGVAQPLRHMLHKFALNSAFEDTRFRPIKHKEFHKLDCEVSLLHSFEEISDYLDWEIGVHGICIDFKVYDDEKNVLFHSSALFLPHVAPNHGFTREKTIEHLIRKGGYKDHIDYSRIKIKATRHQASDCSVTYKEYLGYKEVKVDRITNGNKDS